MKKKSNFQPIEDVYTYSESRILNGNRKVIRWYKNGVLTNIFGYPIQNDKLPISGIVNTSLEIPIRGSNKNKQKKRRQLSSKYSFGMSSSQLLSYNLREYRKSLSRVKPTTNQ